QHSAETIRFAELTHHAHSIGVAYQGAGVLHLAKGEWATARPLIERAIPTLRSGNLFLASAVPASALVLAQLGETSEALDRLQEGERLLEARRFGASNQQIFLGRASLLLGRLDEARTVGTRVVEWFPFHPGSVAHAQHLLGDVATHPDRFDAESGESYYRQALALAHAPG